MYFLLDTYCARFAAGLTDLSLHMHAFREKAPELDFDFCMTDSSVYSSNIEGNTLDLNSFTNQLHNKSITKEVAEIQNLITAYQFAQSNALNETNFLHTHALLSQTLVIPSKQGFYRDDAIGVFGKNGLVYLAVEAQYVSAEMSKLFEDIQALLTQSLTEPEILYYAALIHLVFVHIHPFVDGNGRAARLLEKWFLTSKLWPEFWKIRSEEYYWTHRSEYYANLNLWPNYYTLDYTRSDTFLQMLPQSL